MDPLSIVNGKWTKGETLKQEHLIMQFYNKLRTNPEY